MRTCRQARPQGISGSKGGSVRLFQSYNDLGIAIESLRHTLVRMNSRHAQLNAHGKALLRFELRAHGVGILLHVAAGGYHAEFLHARWDQQVIVRSASAGSSPLIVA